MFEHAADSRILIDYLFKMKDGGSVGASDSAFFVQIVDEHDPKSDDGKDGAEAKLAEKYQP